MYIAGRGHDAAVGVGKHMAEVSELEEGNLSFRVGNSGSPPSV